MAGPQEELVARIHRKIAAFTSEHGEASVEIEFPDGAVRRLQSISAEPGFGFVTLCPYREDGEPEEVIVPLGAVRQLIVTRAEPEQRFGFSVPAEPT